MTNPFGTPTTNLDNTFELDLTQVEQKVLLPEGEYIGKLIDIEKTTSKAGNPMWVWTFAVAAGPFAGEELKLFTAVTPAAMWKLTETLEALGLGKAGSIVKFTPADVLGVKAILHVQHDEYEGKPRPSLNKITAPFEGPGTKFVAGSQTPTAKPAVQQTALDVTSDDMPF